MAISYTYEVKSVNEESNYMEVEYTADGFDPITVGTQIPTDQDDVNYFIDAFAPYGVWLASTVVKKPLPVGTKGSISQSDLNGDAVDSPEVINMTSISEVKAGKISEIDQWKRNKRESFVVIDGFVLKPNQRYLSNLRAAKLAIDLQDSPTVGYKFANDVYQDVDSATLDSLIEKLTLLIQSIFDDERAKIDEVMAMTDIDSVIAYSPSFGSEIPTS
jgi:hypothetical protein